MNDASGAGDAVLQGNNNKLINQDIIQGTGIIGNGSLAVFNSGTIDANTSGGKGALTLNGSGGVTNTKALEATGGGTLTINTTVNNAGGNITAGAASVVNLYSATIQGGTLNNSAAGIFQTVPGTTSVLDGSTAAGAVTISAGSTYTASNNGSTNLLGTITDKGALQFNGGANANGYLNIASATVTLNGGGVLRINDASGAGDAVLQGNGEKLINQDTIQGTGIIGNGSLTVVNSGTIDANTSSGKGALTLNGSGGITNTGVLEAAGGLLHVTGGPFTNFSGSTLTGGTYSASTTLEIDELGSSGGEITTNAANIILSGPASAFIDAGGRDVTTRLATNAAAGSFTISAGRNFTTAGNFDNLGTLGVGTGSKFNVNGNLLNFSGTTLTGGTYNVGGTLQFNGANIATNAAIVTLTGASSQIVNQSGANGLTSFAVNASTGHFTVAGGRVFRTAGAFTNDGSLTTTGTGSQFTTGSAHFTNSGTLTSAGGDSEVATGTGAFTNTGTVTVASGSTFGLGGSFTNFSGTILSGGIYNVIGTMEFPGAQIVTNAANIVLTGSGSRILNSSNSANALANFSTNASAGSFSLLGGRALTTIGGFSNAGTLDIGSGSTFTLGGLGKFTQTAGKLTDDGTLATGGSVIVSGGSLFGKGVIRGTLQSSGVITPGDSAATTGILTDSGAYKENAGGSLDISIAGTTPGSGFDQLNSTTASLGGTLNVKLINGFVPKLGTNFKILNFGSETGHFATVNGLAINSSEHFALTYQGSDVLLTAVSGAASPVGAAILIPPSGVYTRSGRLDMRPLLPTSLLPSAMQPAVARSPSTWASSRPPLADTSSVVQTASSIKLQFNQPTAPAGVLSSTSRAGLRTDSGVRRAGRFGRRAASGNLQFSLLKPLSMPVFFLEVD
jgi:fibronectin-binding autotransporter adhesin